jgi:microcystin-dependent protein
MTIYASSGVETASITLTGGGTLGVPSGVIVMWSGTVANIPADWVLCDGSNGTPDLRNRFVVGAHSDGQSGVTFNADTGAISGNYSPGNTGGEVAHQLTVAEMPAHSHPYAANRGGSDYGGSNPANGSPNNGVTSNTGGNDYHENRPPYYALAYIMKT